MGPSALPACERKRTLDSRSGAVAAKKNCATMRYNCISVASSIILKRKVVNTRHRVMTSRKFHLSLKYLCGEAYQRHGMVLVKQKESPLWFGTLARISRQVPRTRMFSATGEDRPHLARKRCHHDGGPFPKVARNHLD